MIAAAAHRDLRRMVAASLESLESTVLEFRRMLKDCPRTDCPGRDAFAAELLLREALTNSVCHACGRDPRRLISVFIRLRGDRFTLVVRDDGAGFDWRTELNHNALDGDVGGRGLAIYRAYADRIRFNRKGNQLILVRRFSRSK
jgi:anti-sigma regulatory factor (Ser/Thr protein kinase)